MEVFEAPSVGDEFGGEPVEEFGVRGLGAVDAEVTGSFDDAGPKMVVPQAVGDDACGEGILRRSDPVGECDTAFLFGGVCGESDRFSDHGKDPGGNFFARLRGVSAMIAFGRAGLFEGSGVDFGNFGELLDFSAELCALGDGFCDLGGRLGGDLVEGRDGRDFGGEILWETVHCGCDALPVCAVGGDLDGVVEGEPIREWTGGVAAVAAPCDAGDALGFCELDLGPAAAGLFGDPAEVVAVFSVVEVTGLVLGVGTAFEGPRNGDLRASGGEGHVFWGGICCEDLEFVDAGLGFPVGGGGDGESQELGVDWSEGVLVFCAPNGGSKSGVGGGGLMSNDAFEGDEIGGDGAAGIAAAQQDDALFVEGDGFGGGLEGAPAALSGDGW